MNGATAEQGVLGSITEQVEQTMGNKIVSRTFNVWASAPASKALPCTSSCPHCFWWGPVIWKCERNKPFTSRLLFVWCFVKTIVTLTESHSLLMFSWILLISLQTENFLRWFQNLISLIYSMASFAFASLTFVILCSYVFTIFFNWKSAMKILHVLLWIFYFLRVF